MRINRWFLALLMVVPLGVMAQEPLAPQANTNKGYVAGTPAPQDAQSTKEKDRLPTLKEFIHGNGSGNGSRTGGNRSIGFWEGVQHMDDWMKENLW